MALSTFRYGYIPGAPDNTGTPEEWSRPTYWEAQGVRLGYKIAGSAMQDYSGSSIQTGQLTALGGSGSDLNTSNSNVLDQINHLIDDQDLSGLGVGTDTTRRSNGQAQNNAEIQYNPTMGVGDELVVDFGKSTNSILIGTSLFYATEVVPWKTTGTAEQLRFELLKRVNSGGDVTVGDREYDIVANISTEDDDGDNVQAATGTGRWTTTTNWARLNPGQDEFTATAANGQIFDAILIGGADYDYSFGDAVLAGYTGTTITDVSDYLFSYIEFDADDTTTPQEDLLNCFGGTNDPTGWGDVNFAYLWFNQDNQQNTLDPVDTEQELSIINPLENRTDLLDVPNLPTGVTGLGVGTSGGNGSQSFDEPIVPNPEIQADPRTQIDRGDELQIDFNQQTRSARIGLSLFYSREEVKIGRQGNQNIYEVRPEQMRYELYMGDQLVGSRTTVAAMGTGTYRESSTGDPGNPGNFTFRISNSQPFDTIRFIGANYGSNPGQDPYVSPPNPEMVSDYLVRGVCLDNVIDLGTTTSYTYESIADAGDYIIDFKSTDAIVISKSGFELDAYFNSILGETGLGVGDIPDYFQYNGSNGQLFVDPDGTGSGGATLLTTLVGAPDLNSLYFVD